MTRIINVTQIKHNNIRLHIILLHDMTKLFNIPIGIEIFLVRVRTWSADTKIDRSRCQTRAFWFEPYRLRALLKRRAIIPRACLKNHIGTLFLNTEHDLLI
ncbi:hypothetical protein D3C80_1690260 [compost metagenome]